MVPRNAFTFCNKLLLISPIIVQPRACRKTPCTGNVRRSPPACHVLCYGAAFAGHRTDIFGFSWLVPTYNRWASFRMVLALTYGQGFFFRKPLMRSGVHSEPNSGPIVANFGRLKYLPSPQISSNNIPSSFQALKNKLYGSSFCQLFYTDMGHGLLHWDKKVNWKGPETNKIFGSLKEEVSRKFRIILSRLWVTIDGVWIGNWIYWTLTDRNYK
jgi:hypothetical protein